MVPLFFFRVHGVAGSVGQPAYTARPTRLKRVWPAGLRRGFAQQACGKAAQLSYIVLSNFSISFTVISVLNLT
jgi:hypothetical protein